MGFLSKKYFSFSYLTVFPSLLLGLTAHAVEKYSATVEDGTAKVIRADTAVDASPPKNIRHRIIAKADIENEAPSPITMTDESSVKQPILEKTPVIEPKIESKPETKIETKAETATAVSETAAPAVINKDYSAPFDAVPQQHVEEIAQRLKYANALLKRFGRAYDYRSTTLKEFRKILAELESKQEKQKSVN